MRALPVLLAGLAGLFVQGSGVLAQEPVISPELAAAVHDNPWRTAEQKARDGYRHPAETLAFFGVGPESTVVEPLPGWYTEILGPLVRERGRYIAVNMPREPRPGEAAPPPWPETFLAGKETMLGDRARAAVLLTDEGFAPENSVDAILSIRAFHGWVYSGDIDRVLAEFYRSLKPGGVFGVVQHREFEDSPHTPADQRGYLKESFVIEKAEAAGFRLVAKSEINANPADTKDYEIGVWALPPTLYGKDVEAKRRHIRIGESDRMTLKFVKPAG